MACVNLTLAGKLCLGADVNATSKSGGSALLVAAQENHPQVVKVLIESGANLNQKTDKTGQTALWTAAFKGHVEVWVMYSDALGILGN